MPKVTSTAFFCRVRGSTTDELEGWAALAHDIIEGLGMKHGRAVCLDDDVAGLDAGAGRRAAGLDLGHLGRGVDVVEHQSR